MLSRLGLFVAAVLLLPLLARLLADALPDWLAAEPMPLAPLGWALVTAVLLLFLADWLLGLRGGQRLLRLQRYYYLALAVASALLGWLLAYLNVFAESWLIPAGHDVTGSLLQTLLFALTAPAVLLLRAALGRSAPLLKVLAGWPAPRFASREFFTLALLALALLGLTVGSVWPGSGLLWTAPLLLLAGLQGLWHESSIFDGLARGDWGRLLTAALAGLIVGNLLTYAFALGGGHLILQVSFAYVQPGFALFGLLCLQLGDVIAEAWRGKTRAELFPKKPFPVSVVVKK